MRGVEGKTHMKNKAILIPLLLGCVTRFIYGQELLAVAEDPKLRADGKLKISLYVLEHGVAMTIDPSARISVVMELEDLSGITLPQISSITSSSSHETSDRVRRNARPRRIELSKIEASPGNVVQVTVSLTFRGKVLKAPTFAVFRPLE